MDADNSSILQGLFDDSSSLSLGELNKISEKIIGCAFTVSNTLGCGFLEKVYENALAHECRKQGLSVCQQPETRVMYDGVEVGKYEPDLLIEGRIIVELKAVRELNDVMKAQCMNYLKATGIRICLLINFGNPKVEIKRIVV